MTFGGKRGVPDSVYYNRPYADAVAEGGTNVTAATTRFIAAPPNSQVASATEANVRTTFVRACTLTACRIRASAGAGAGDLTVQVRVNGASVGSVATFVAGAGESSVTLADQLAIAASDTVNLTAVNANAVNDATVFGIEFAIAW